MSKYLSLRRGPLFHDWVTAIKLRAGELFCRLDARCVWEIESGEFRIPSMGLLMRIMSTLANPQVHCVSEASCFCTAHPAQLPERKTAEVAVV